MHIRKSRNKIHCSILDLQLNRGSVPTRATNGCHSVVLNKIVHRKPSDPPQPDDRGWLTRTSWCDDRKATEENRDGSDSRAVHLAERFRGGAHDGRTSAQPRAG